ncbi:hypothetical protein GCWU000324_02874 [Kingella oralis ATCC 51147]|uniref:Uncharacterized protein n=1 Tax=Kingella oralis ATCC 51147 TaxID=629741 RepID=C4GME0_9NEIS|nr:hypothetical protein GCWU000324_02874 [Kingella oralis ATCC 51147]
MNWLSGCLTLHKYLMLPPLSPTSSRTQHPFFGNKRALVRRRAKRG